MEHTLNNLLKFSSADTENPKHQKIQSFRYDHSGHVVATNSHVLFASKKPWDIKKSGKTFSKSEYEKGFFVETELAFPEWQKAIPEESGRKVNIKIPEWFGMFGEDNRDATMILDYTDTSKPFFKISSTIGETCLGINAKYLSCFAGEEISFLITSPISPTIVVDKESDLDPLSKNFKENVLKEDWFYLLMPIKLDEESPSEVYL
jgi:hypothetical protein